MTMDPGEDAYSGVIAPETFRLSMFAAVNNNLRVLAADIGIAYLHANTNEKLFTLLGEEYRSLGGKVFVLVKGYMA